MRLGDAFMQFIEGVAGLILVGMAATAVLMPTEANPGSAAAHSCSRRRPTLARNACCRLAGLPCFFSRSAKASSASS